jgi:acetyl/propionyl-CoA carboxylase alpha subunit
METRLRLGPRTLAVGLVAEGDGFAATVEGATHQVRRVAVGPRATIAGASSEQVTVEIDGRVRRAVVARMPERGSERVLVALGGRVYAFEVGDETRGGHAGAGSGTVTAPMPGKIVSVLVAVGDTVVIGQPLVVLEAMKMESTLAAEVAGRVTAVGAVAGTTVTAGEVLVEITTPAE